MVSIKSKPFFWISCDCPSCDAVHPDEAGEVIAYSELEQLNDLAAESGWMVAGRQHYCDRCFDLVCRKCGVALTTDESDAGEYECFKCWPELPALVGDI